MKAIKFFNSEKDHFSEKTLSNMEQNSFSHIITINWTSIEIIIKINLEKP